MRLKKGQDYWFGINEMLIHFFSVILTSNLRKERYRSYYQFTCHVSYSGLTFTTRRKDYLKGCLLFYIPEVYDYYLLEREDIIEI